MNETTTILGFLQQNASWICGVGMLVFAAVQVCLMHKQNRQQIILQRLKLAQGLNETCTHFPYSKKDCQEIIEWLMGHAASFRFLLNDKDMQKYWVLYNLICKFQECKDRDFFEKTSNHDNFYSCAVDLEGALREAEYGIHTKRKLTFGLLKKLLFGNKKPQKYAK